MYTPDKEIDGVRYVGCIMLDQLAAISTASNVDSANDAYPDHRAEAQRDLTNAINLLGDMRGNEELAVLRKIAYAVRVVNLWKQHETYHQKSGQVFYHF